MAEGGGMEEEEIMPHQNSQVKLWSVFRLHYPEIRRALDKMSVSLTDNEIPTRDREIEGLSS